MDVANKFLDVVEILSSKGINTANYNTMIKATILSCKDEILQKYNCRYQDATFEASTPLPTGIIIPNGTQVWVIIPNNDFNQGKKILGTIESLGEDFMLMQQQQQDYEIIGINTLSNTDDIYYLNTDNVNYSYDLYNYTREEGENDIDLDIKSLNQYISQSSTIYLGATIKTNIEPRRQNRGHYGITCTIEFQDANDSTKTYIKNYTLDEDNMVDNPYRLLYETEQYQLFDIDSTNFIRVQKITIFNKDFPNAAALDTNRRLVSGDIALSNIQLCGAVKNVSSNKGFAISFETPKGTFFAENSQAGEIRIITAYLKIDGKRIKDTDNLAFYWGRQNMGIFQGNAKYNTFLGRGWECLNEGNNIDQLDLNAMVQWIPASDTLTITLQQATAYNNNIKVAIVYNGKCITKTINIKNLGAVSSITIESSGGQNFHYGLGHPTLTCLVDGNQPSSNYNYYWIVEDSNGTLIPLVQTTDENNNYNTLIEELNQLNEDIDNGSKIKEKWQDRLDYLQNQLKEFNFIQRVQDNKIYDVQIKDIVNFATFKCSVESLQGVYLGTASITLINSYQDQPGYSLIINNGDQVFQYNEDGVAPNNGSLLNPQLIPTLNFSLYDESRNLIDSNIIKNSDNCSIRWIMPIKNTMIQNSSENGSSAGVDSTLSYLYYDNLIDLTYNIKQNYNPSTENNQIELIVKYNGLTLSAKTNFTFIKQGQPGTNGTEYIVKVVPNTRNKNFISYPMITNRNNSYYINYGINSYEEETNINLISDYQFFKAQLWKNGILVWQGFTANRGTGTPPSYVYWDMLVNNYGHNLQDESAFEITNPYNGQMQYTGNFDIVSPLANIVRCHIMFEGKDYYGTLPIITAETTSEEYKISLKDYTGFRYVTYTSAGVNPQYSTAAPFTFICQQKMDNVWTDISTVVGSHMVTYTPTVIGNIQVYDESANNNRSFIDKSDLLQCETARLKRLNLATNEWNFIPAAQYSGQCINLAIVCTLRKSNELIGYIHIPVHFLLNKYGLANVNAWDGNSIEINEQGGFILSPQVGSGIKDSNNNFTGVLMGSVKESGAILESQGLFGYSAGVRSFFLNAKNGSAIFGKNSGKLTIDPSTDKMMIYSSNYWRNYTEEGLPQAYNSDNENHQGLLIDLSTPQIKYGNGNFSVDSNGIMRCQGAIISGTIALTAGSTIDRQTLLGDASIGSITDRTKCITQLSNTGVWVTPLNGLPDENGNAIVGTTSGTKIDANGVGIYNGGIRVALYGQDVSIGAQSQSKFIIESDPDKLVYQNASNTALFAIQQGKESEGLKNGTLASYAAQQAIQLNEEQKVPLQIYDQDILDQTAVTIKIRVNNQEIQIPKITQVDNNDVQNYTEQTYEEDRIEITLTAHGVEEIENYRTYEETTTQIRITPDTTPIQGKNYYIQKNNNQYSLVEDINYGTEADEDGTSTAADNPHALNWYEYYDDTQTKLYACSIIVTYKANIVTSAGMSLNGNMELIGQGYPIHVENNSWSNAHQSDTFIRVTNSSKNTSVSFGIGSGGDNHGIYSHKHGKWLIYYDVNGVANIPTNLIVQQTKANTETQIKAINKAGGIYLYSNENASGNRSNRGIYTYNANGASAGVIAINQANEITIRDNHLLRPNGTYIYGLHTTKGPNNTTRSYYCFGNNAEITRFATKTCKASAKGVSFMIANGYYAVGSAENDITTVHTNVYLCGGNDGSYYIRSYPTRARYYNKAANVYITTKGTFGCTSSSSIRYKHDVEYISNINNSVISNSKKIFKKNKNDDDIMSILKLPVVKFKYNQGYLTGEHNFDYSKQIVGLIAEDVAEICPDCATYVNNDKGEKIPESYDTKELLVRMLYVIQQQQKEIEELKQKLS